MADKIKKFFSKKKEEAKFKLKVGNMGTGRKLNDEPQPASSSPKYNNAASSFQPPKRKELSEEARYFIINNEDAIRNNQKICML